MLSLDLTLYHAKYYAFELTKRCPIDSVEKLAGALGEGSSLLLAFSRREREFWDRVLNLGREKGDKSHFLCSTVRKLNPGIADEAINVAVEELTKQG